MTISLRVVLKLSALENSHECEGRYRSAPDEKGKLRMRPLRAIAPS